MIKGKMKKKNIADARAIAMYLSRVLTKESLERIGLEFGGRDHSTVSTAIDKIKEDLKTDDMLDKMLKEIKTKLQ